jgi:hypothetical protein
LHAIFYQKKSAWSPFFAFRTYLTNRSIKANLVAVRFLGRKGPFWGLFGSSFPIEK